MDLIHPRALRTFVVLSEELHFGRAARRLGISQSTVSEQLRNLESELGIVLFDRHSRGVALTQAGGELLDAARQLVNGHESLVELARSIIGAERRVVLGIAPGATPLVAKLTEVASASDIEIAIRVMTLMEGVRAIAAGEITAMLCGLTSGVSVPELREITVLDTEVVAVMSPTHPLARFDPIPRAQFRGCRVLVPVGFGGASERALTISGGSVPNVVEIPSLLHSVAELVAGGPVGLNVQWFYSWWRSMGLVDRALDPPISGRLSIIHRPSLTGTSLAIVEELAVMGRNLLQAE